MEAYLYTFLQKKLAVLKLLISHQNNFRGTSHDCSYVFFFLSSKLRTKLNLLLWMDGKDIDGKNVAAIDGKDILSASSINDIHLL